MKKTALPLLLLCLMGVMTSPKLSAQNGNGKHIPCYTSELYQLQLKEHPEATEAEKRFNVYVEQFKRAQQNSAQKTSGYEGSKYIIPTVVHVVHSGQGQPDSITKEQVISMFPHLFDDFRNVRGTRGFGTGADTHIEPELATFDPNGNPTNGITYTKNAEATQVVIDSDSAGIKPGLGNIKLKNLIRWDTTRYCNVWIVKSIRSVNSGPGGTIAGYAQYPWYPSPATDGIVVAHPYFGTTGTAAGYSNTTTHEFGHWLALIHPFDSSGKDGCDPGDCLKWGDKVCDVPPVNPTFKQIIFRKNSCNTDSPDMADISRNYMDYAVQDEMANHYSAGQAVRSIAALENPEYTRKNKLWSEENSQRTGVGKWGAPRANFWVNTRRTCVGQPITFIDYCANKPTTYRWEFEGGQPATSAEAYPVVKYNQAGQYKVKLWVTNLSGKSDSVVKDSFITVTDFKTGLPFKEKFDGNTFPPANWYVDNPDFFKAVNGLTWERSPQGSGDTSLGCAVMPFFYYNDYKQRDGLVLPTFDLSSVREAGLTFNLSYRPLFYYSTAAGDVSEEFLYSDTLEVQVSIDCGVSWWTVARDGGERLMTASGPINSNSQTNPAHIIPAPWKKFTVNLNEYTGKSNLMVRFTGLNGWGNNLYLDDVMLLAQTVGNTMGRNANLAVSNIRVEPNPFQNSTEVVIENLKNANSGVCQIQVTDLHGRVMLTQKVEITENGAESYHHTVDLSAFSDGIYFLKISDGETFRTQKIIKE